MLKKLLLIAGTFYILFYPPVFGAHSLRIIAVIAFLYLLPRVPYFKVLFNVSRLEKVYFTWSVILIWISSVIILNNSSIGSVNPFVYWLFSVIPASLMIGNEIRESNGDLFTLIDLTLYAGLLQGICSVLAFFVPSIKQFFLSQLASAEVIDLAHYGYFVDMRLYGFANGLTYAMPVLQAFLTMIAIYLAINKNIKYLLFVPFTLFSAVVNARTSLVVIGICGIILLLQFKGYDSKKVGKMAFLSCGAVCLLLVGIKIVQTYSPNTYLWIADGANQIVLFLEGKFDSGYFAYLLNADRWRFPEGVYFVFGKGLRIIGDNDSGFYTDVGYVNDVWLGGILYAVVIYSIVCSYLIKLAKAEVNDNASQNMLKYLSFSLLVASVFLNLKGYVVNLNCIANFFVVISVYQQLTRPYDPTMNQLRGII